MVGSCGWSPLAVGGGWWRLVVGGWWRLAVDGSWRLAVGGPLGQSLRAVLRKKKIWSLKDRPAALCHSAHFAPLWTFQCGPAMACCGVVPCLAALCFLLHCIALFCRRLRVPVRCIALLCSTAVSLLLFGLSGVAPLQHAALPALCCVLHCIVLHCSAIGSTCLCVVLLCAAPLWCLCSSVDHPVRSCCGALPCLAKLCCVMCCATPQWCWVFRGTEGKGKGVEEILWSKQKGKSAQSLGWGGGGRGGWVERFGTAWGTGGHIPWR